MTIKQQGGVFGRHPEFGTVDVDGLATVKQLTIQSDVPQLRLADELSGSVYNTDITQSGFSCYYDNRVAGSHIFQISGQTAFTVRYDKNIVLADGNLIVPSGKGIDFSATSGSGTSELFDDYEEGTWTPAISGGWTGVTYTIQEGTYTKIGNLVTAWFYLRFSGTDAASAVALTGLPFTPLGSNANKFGTINFVDAPMGGGTANIAPYVGATTTFNFFEVPGSASPVQSTGNASLDYLIGCVSYSV